MPEQAQPQPQTNQPQSQGKSNSTTCIIIAVILVVLLIILGIGGFLAWKYFVAKNVQKLKNAADTSTTTSTSESTKPKTYSWPSGVNTNLQYPGSKITKLTQNEVKQGTNSIVMQTSASVRTVYNYYLSLSETSGWTIQSQNYSEENAQGIIDFQGDNFYCNVTVDWVNAGTTKITMLVSPLE